MQFSTSKHGYDMSEVDEAVSSLKTEVNVWKERALKAEADYIQLKEKENEIKKSGENIALALTAAIEKAKQIEASSKNVYKLKIQQISILYDRWEMLLNEILQKYPLLEDSNNIKKMLDDFKGTIEKVVTQNFEQMASFDANPKTDSMRILLSKMSKNRAENSQRENIAKIKRSNLSNDLKQGKTELLRLEEKAVMIKPITDITLEKGEGYETLADKFLKDEEISTETRYTNFMSKAIGGNDFPSPNESGFNLKEAVNPKDDLDEIMKSFDF
ncbi:MAG: hypothetical protein ACOX6H_03775, partial [Christensenellales bacterium]